jgi:hypothetical protein
VLKGSGQAGDNITAGKGKRHFGVEVQLTNVGTVTYKDSPSNGATLVGTSGHEFNAEFGDVGGEVRLSTRSIATAAGSNNQKAVEFNRASS